MLTALQLTNFISLQKRAILRMVEMNNDELILFAEARITSSYIDLQKEAIKTNNIAIIGAWKKSYICDTAKI